MTVKAIAFDLYHFLPHQTIQFIHPVRDHTHQGLKCITKGNQSKEHRIDLHGTQTISAKCPNAAHQSGHLDC